MAFTFARSIIVKCVVFCLKTAEIDDVEMVFADIDESDSDDEEAKEADPPKNSKEELPQPEIENMKDKSQGQSAIEVK